MTTWIPGVLALVGALGGVLLTDGLSRRRDRDAGKRERLEHAARCVALAIVAQNFAATIGMHGRLKSVTDADVEALERRMYLQNLERLYTTMREARESVAVLAADGHDVGEHWRTDQEMYDHLDEVYAKLQRCLLT